MLNRRDKFALGLVQALILIPTGIYIGLNEGKGYKMPDPWFGWIMVAIGVLGGTWTYWRHRNSRDPWQ